MAEKPKEVPLLEATDEQLKKLSKERKLSLSLDEMHTVRDYFKKQDRNPRDIELEACAQCWSEHCSYKSSRPILKRTVFKVQKPQSVLPIAEDAGVVEFDDDHYYVFALESHNHPSALDPYGGAATGVGGIIRDVVCMGAQPIALADPLFFGPLDYPVEKVPEGTKHPDFLFRGVVKGISDYGNQVGIPTVSGMVYFDKSYVGNCLVNVGCVGIMKKEHLIRSKVGSVGDIFILAGGATGRDGIHGVTFASAELDKESEESSLPAVQLGDPITKEPLIHACLEALHKGLLTGMKDLGGGGLSCVCGEMAYSSGFGAEINLDHVHLKQPDMEPWEIWVSESQERMMVSVTPENVDKVLEIFKFWDITANVVGRVIEESKAILEWYGEVIYDMELEFTTGAVSYNRPYKKIESYDGPEIEVPEPADYNETLLKIISSYNIASKEWVIRQYDHVIRGNTILTPMQGVYETPGPGDATIVRPVPGKYKGLAFSSDVNPRMVEIDPYWGAASSVEESFRNMVAVGATPHSMSDCLCFGNPEKEEIMGQFVAACEGLHFTADSFGVPFISGNVSFYNESESGAILPTPTIMTAGIIDDVRNAVSMDLKGAGNSLYIIGGTDNELGGSEYIARIYPEENGKVVPRVYPDKFKMKMKSIFSAMDKGLVSSCHDIAEGGLAVALAEMCFAGNFGANVDIDDLPGRAERADYKLFSESNGRWIVEVKPEGAGAFEAIASGNNIDFIKLGQTTEEKKLVIGGVIDLPLEKLHKAWKQPIYDIVGGE